MSGHVLRKRRGRDVASELVAVDQRGAQPRTSPRANGLATIQKPNGRNRPCEVVEALAIPHGNAHVEQRITQSEEHFHVVIKSVRVTAGNRLCEEVPMARWCRRRRSVRPILRDHLRAIVELRAQMEDLVCFLNVIAVRIQRRRGGAHVLQRRECERDDEPPMRGQELLWASGRRERLPAVRIVNGIHGIDRCVPRVVGVRAGMEVAQLIRAVTVTEIKHRTTRGQSEGT